VPAVPAVPAMPSKNKQSVQTTNNQFQHGSQSQHYTTGRYDNTGSSFNQQGNYGSISSHIGKRRRRSAQFKKNSRGGLTTTTSKNKRSAQTTNNHLQQGSQSQHYKPGSIFNHNWQRGRIEYRTSDQMPTTSLINF
jgi:hypothetical protein